MTRPEQRPPVVDLHGFVAPPPAYDASQAATRAAPPQPVVEEAARPGWVAANRSKDLHGATGWGRPPEAVLNAAILIVLILAALAMRGRPTFSGAGAVTVLVVVLRIAIYVRFRPVSPRPPWSWKNPRLR